MTQGTVTATRKATVTKSILLSVLMPTPALGFIDYFLYSLIRVLRAGYIQLLKNSIAGIDIHH